MHRHTLASQPGAVVKALGKGARLQQQAWQGAYLGTERRSIEHRADRGAGLGVLVGHQVQQRPAAGQHHPLANGAALEFQGDLCGAQGIHPG
ncbi:hypothetical protein D3C76_1753790 [compost metagenome]